MSAAAPVEGLWIDLPDHHLRTERWRLPNVGLWLTGRGDPIGPVIRAHRRIHPRGDARLLRRAYLTAERMHRGQTRKSGEPYITHPVAVAHILADLGMDTTTLVAAMLHDTVEDTEYTLPALTSDFGDEVALLVDGVTKLDKAFFGGDAEVETIRKMLLRAAQDVRVLIIKIADRLHNMRTLDVRSPSSRSRIARATQDVLVPLCDRLGIQALKRGLEDTVLAALEPESYADIEAHVRHRPQWTAIVHETTERLGRSLVHADIDATVRARPRHYFSIWKDTIEAGHPLDYDSPRIAVVVDGKPNDCYTALGTLHSIWRPVPGRFKDFIASPKNNLYRSLHTTVIGPGSQPVEVLIRTVSMHHASELGIAANFRGGPVGVVREPLTETKTQLGWLRRVVDWQQSVDEAEKFIDALRCDLTERQIQVFTTTGHSVLLPVDATPVDFAYTLGAAIGHACVGAAINGRLVPLSSRLGDGDVVDVITRRAAGDRVAGPAVEWLAFVRSPQARLEIRRWFDEARDEDETTDSQETISARVARGRTDIGAALRREGRWLAGDGPMYELAAHLGYPEVDAVYVAVADGRLTAAEVVTQLIALVDRARPPLAG